MLHDKLPGLIKRSQDAAELLAVALVLSLIFTVLFYFGWGAVPFKNFSEAALLEIVSSLLVVSVFTERAVEAFLVPVRTPRRQKIEQEMDELRTAVVKKEFPELKELDKAVHEALQEKEMELEAYEQLKKAALEHSVSEARQQKALKALKEKEYELEAYRLETARCAYWASFALGLAVSLAGVRALSGLVDAKEVARLHSAFFNLVDIVVTGGVIAGGSAAIDKMGRRISKTLRLTSATTSKADRAA